MADNAPHPAQHWIDQAAAARDTQTELLCWQRAFEISPDDVEIRFRLARACSRSGQDEQAQEHFAAVLRAAPNHAGALCGLGAIAHRVNRLAEAVGYYQAALRSNPGMAKARFNLASVYAAEGRRAAAIAEFRQGLQYAPQNVVAHYELARLYFRTHQYVLARAELEVALRLRPDHVPSRCLLAATYARLGEDNLALQEYRSALLMKPELAEARVAMGRIYARQKRFEEAATAFEEAVSIAPQDAVTRDRLADAYWALGRREEALAAAERATQLAPERADVWGHWGQYLLDEGRPEEAVAAWEHATQCDARSARWARLLGLAYSELGRYREARAQMLRALELAPEKRWPRLFLLADEPDGTAPRETLRRVDLSRPSVPDEVLARARAVLGHIALGLGRVEAALEQYQLAIGLDPRSAVARAGLALAQMGTAPSEQVVAELSRAADLAPTSIHVWQLLGDALFEQKQWTEACAAYRRAGTVSEPNAALRAYALYCLARAARRVGDNAAAVAAYEQSVALRPDYPNARYGLAVAYHHAGQIEQAQMEYEQCLRLTPTHANAQYGIGACYQARGDLAAAAEWYEKALVLDGRLAKARLSLARACQQLGDETRATAAYQAYLQLEPSGPGASEARLHLQRARLKVPDHQSPEQQKPPAADLGDWDAYWSAADQQ